MLRVTCCIFNFFFRSSSSWLFEVTSTISFKNQRIDVKRATKLTQVPVEGKSANLRKYCLLLHSHFNLPINQIVFRKLLFDYVESLRAFVPKTNSVR